MEGYVVTTAEDWVERCNVLVTTAGCKDIPTGKHFRLVKNDTIFFSMSHSDGEFQVVKFTLSNGKNRILLAEGRLVSLGIVCAIMTQGFVTTPTPTGFFQTPSPGRPSSFCEVSLTKTQAKFGTVSFNVLGLERDDRTRQEVFAALQGYKESSYMADEQAPGGGW